MSTLSLTAVTPAYPFITDRIQGAVYAASDVARITPLQFHIDNTINHPSKIWTFTGLDEGEYIFSVDIIDINGIKLDNITILDVIPSNLYDTIGASQSDIKRLEDLIVSNFSGTVDSLTFNPGTPTTNTWYRANAGSGTYIHFYSSSGVQITVNDSDGQVDFIFNNVTGYWTKVINPLISIANDLVTNSVSKALSAAQGFKLRSQIQGSIQGTGTININLNGSITVAGELYGVIGGTYIPDAIPAATTAGVTTGGIFAGTNYIYLNASDNQVYLVNYTSINSIDLSEHILLGWIYDLNLSTLATTSNITVDGLNRSLTQILSFLNQTSFVGLFNSSYSINIDSTVQKITFSEAWLLAGNETLHIVAGETNYVGTPGTLTVLIYNRSNSLIYLVNHDEASEFYFNTHVVFGALWGWDVETLQVNGNISVNGRFKGAGDNNATGELILPPKFFLLTGETLPLYKNCIVRSTDELKNETVLMISGADTDLNLPLIESFEVAQLSTQKLSKSTVRIYSKKYQDTAFDYGVDVQVVSTNPGSKAGNYNHLQIGDSLSNRGVTKYTKNYLAQFGIITTGVGTLNNSGQLGEGREGWTFKNFIGADNYHTFLANAITPSTSGTTTNMDTQNPFLKVATSGDKSARPDMCFRNTGVHNELSYTTDTDKTGTFYIFDLAAYMSNHSVPTPHVVTIALSTNDLTFYGNTNGVASSLLGAEIMISQIRAALPTVPIGIIPNVGFGDNNQSEWSWACDFINQLNTKLTTMALSNVNVVGVWASMDKRFAFDYSAMANLRNDGNLTKKFTKNESVHFNLQGYLQYAKALGAYIANVI